MRVIMVEVFVFMFVCVASMGKLMLAMETIMLMSMVVYLGMIVPA